MEVSSTEPTMNMRQEEKGENTTGRDTELDTSSASTKLRQTAVANGTHSPRSSAPSTPSANSRTTNTRRTSQSATSPVAKNITPRPSQALRRTSSSQIVERPPSSPQLSRKPSRKSLDGTTEEQHHRLTPKRSISNLITGLREARSTMESIEEPVHLTAAQIATEHFAQELAGHSQSLEGAETVVILHDACYGHRYSRLKATKTTLSLIVERPERIHACVLGASTAYVRLGEHHAGGKCAPHPDYNHVSSTPFKIRRSSRSMDITSTYVTNVHGTSWMSELQHMCHTAPEKLAMGAKELGRMPAPGEAEKQTLHEGDLYLAPESLHAFQGALGGVADAVDAVFATDTATTRAFVAVRPPGHHCSADLPSGFCWLNNVHIGIEYAAQRYGLTHAAILDFDLHHGDGSQAITWERNSKNNEKRLNAKVNSKLRLAPDLGYYSIHDINSYPCEMGDDQKVQAASLCIENAHGQSIWNVHLQPWKSEDDFWRLYEERYSILLDKAGDFLEHHDQNLTSEGKVQPRSAIFISAGFDASEWEGSGMQRHKVNVPTEFYARFTKDIVKLSQSIKSCAGKVISVLEGGYSDRALCTGVLSHLSGLCTSPVTPTTNGVGSLLEQMNGLSISNLTTSQYDKAWWSAANMTALENKVNPPPPPQAKKGRTGPQPTYATPTESFAYKVIDPQKFARSVSGTMREAAMPARPPTPPPPEVDWVVATQELSKLLVPSNRQTKSCTPEDLAVVRTKKERQSAMPIMSTEQGQPRQLRDRKMRATAYAESAHSDETESIRAVSRTESRSSRRETIDVLPSEAGSGLPRRQSRRLSAGSALGFDSGPVDTTAAPPVPSVPQATPMAYHASSTMKPPPAPLPKARPFGAKPPAPSGPRKIVPPSNTRPPSTAQSALLSIVSGQPLPSSADNKATDIDGLTSGMKKVTLKVSTTKEEHDRKQKEKLDADRRARALKGAETRRINAAAKKATMEASARQMPALDQPQVQPNVATREPPAMAEIPVGQHSAVQDLPSHQQPSTSSMYAPNKYEEAVGDITVGDITAQPLAKPSMSSQAVLPAASTVARVDAPSSGYVKDEPGLLKLVNSHDISSGPPAAHLQPRSVQNVSAMSGPASTPPSSSSEVPMDYVNKLPHFEAEPDKPTISAPGSRLPNTYEGRPPSSSGTLPVWSSTGPIPFATTLSRPDEQTSESGSTTNLPETLIKH